MISISWRRGSLSLSLVAQDGTRETRVSVPQVARGQGEGRVREETSSAKGPRWYVVVVLVCLGAMTIVVC